MWMDLSGNSDVELVMIDWMLGGGRKRRIKAPDSGFDSLWLLAPFTEGRGTLGSYRNQSWREFLS